jgi:hypothetical protein
MWELLHNGAFVFWAAVVLICTVPTVAHYWYKARKASLEASLKRRMIDRGMSAEEIRQVLSASADATEAAEEV